MDAYGFTLVEIMIVVAIIGLLAALAVPNYVQARKDSQGTLCCANLEKLNGAKQQWGFENNAGALDTPTMNDLIPYLTNQQNGTIECPAQGVYTIGDLSSPPTCSLADGNGNHELR